MKSSEPRLWCTALEADDGSELLPDPTPSAISLAIDTYRMRYASTGYAENQLYPGIVEVLRLMRSRGHRLHIATSKRVDFATRILEHFGIADLFDSVHGCDLHRSKDQLLRDIRDATHQRPAVMVGDRGSDFEAAALVGIPSVGVAWGYGDEHELARADLRVEEPGDLLGSIERIRIGLDDEAVEP